MAYTYTALATNPDNSLSPGASIPVGTVLRYNNILLQAMRDMSNIGGIYVTESGIKNFLTNNWLSYVNPSDVGSIGNSSTVYTLYVQSGAADVTLSDKVTAGFTKTVEKLNENRTHIKAAEADIAGLKTRVTAVEGVAASKAAIDDAALASTTTVLSASKTMQEISDAETRAKNSAVEQIMDGITPAELDSLREIAADLTSKDTVIGSIVTSMAKNVSIESQTLTSGEQAQARTNIGAVSTTEMTTAITTAVTAATNNLLGDVAAVDIDAMFANLQTI